MRRRLASDRPTKLTARQSRQIAGHTVLDLQLVAAVVSVDPETLMKLVTDGLLVNCGTTGDPLLVLGQVEDLLRQRPELQDRADRTPLATARPKPVPEPATPN